MLALSDISKLEMSRGRHRTIGHGLLAGILIGGTIGAVGGAAGGSGRCNSTCINIDRTGGALIVGVTGAVVGGVLGVVVGALHKSERFKHVSVISPAALMRTAAAHAIIAPINGGKALALGVHL